MLKNYSYKVGMNFWHIEFATKYRYKMFRKEEQEKIAEASIRKSCSRHNIKIHRISVLPDHVHMLVTLPHNVTESFGMQIIKGGSAYYFFKHNTNARLRLPQGHLWSAGGCATTVGYNEYGTVDNYILKQKEHHGVA